MQRPAPEAVARRAEKADADENARSETLALEILKLAVSHGMAAGIDAETIISNSEQMWQWTTTDVWPPAKNG